MCGGVQVVFHSLAASEEDRQRDQELLEHGAEEEDAEDKLHVRERAAAAQSETRSSIL